MRISRERKQALVDVLALIPRKHISVLRLATDSRFQILLPGYNNQNLATGLDLGLEMIRFHAWGLEFGWLRLNTVQALLSKFSKTALLEYLCILVISWHQHPVHLQT